MPYKRKQATFESDPNRHSTEQRSLSNTEIANQLASLAQLLSTQKENPNKAKAYRRAAVKIGAISESLDELVHDEADLTQYSGIGIAIASAIREIVLTGSLGKLEKLRTQAGPELVDISAYPRLDPKRILRIYKKLKISSIHSLRDRLEEGEIAKMFGARMAEHVRQGLTESHSMLLHRADELSATLEHFLLQRCGVRAVAGVRDFRRRVEIIDEISFVVDTEDFPAVVGLLGRYGGHTPLIRSSKMTAMFALSSGIKLLIQSGTQRSWGLSLIAATGSKAHLKKLTALTGSLTSVKKKGPFPSEDSFYDRFGFAFIEPELREGREEVDLALQGALPVLVSVKDICGELHAHSTASDGSHSIEQMASAARDRGYEYTGITDHSQSLKIAGGLPVDELWKQVRFIDKLNERVSGIHILKSSEVDILADGSLDYPEDLLRELDYTVCSIHSRFGLDKKQQTERIMRAMDNRYFNILGHATGRLLLKRPGYEIDIERIIAHARQTGCFFEINSSPDRLDLSADNARATAAAGIKIAISTDAHSP